MNKLIKGLLISFVISNTAIAMQVPIWLLPPSNSNPSQGTGSEDSSVDNGSSEEDSSEGESSSGDVNDEETIPHERSINATKIKLSDHRRELEKNYNDLKSADKYKEKSYKYSKKCKGEGCKFGVSFKNYKTEYIDDFDCKKGEISWSVNGNQCYGKIDRGLKNGESYVIKNALNDSIGNVNLTCQSGQIILGDKKCEASCKNQLISWGDGCEAYTGHMKPKETKVIVASQAKGNFFGDINIICDNGIIGAISQRCKQGVSYNWEAGDWSECEGFCQDSLKRRVVVCKDPSGVTVDDSKCTTIKPKTEEVCTNACFSSCAELKTNNPLATSGIYKIGSAITNIGEDAYCEMNTDGGGWTAIMQRKRGDELVGDYVGRKTLFDFLKRGYGEPKNIGDPSKGYSLSKARRSHLKKNEYLFKKIDEENKLSPESYIIGVSKNDEIFTQGEVLKSVATGLDYIKALNNSIYIKDIKFNKQTVHETNKISFITQYGDKKIVCGDDDNLSTEKGEYYGACVDNNNPQIDGEIGEISDKKEVKIWGRKNTESNLYEQIFVREFNPEKVLKANYSSCSEIKADNTNSQSGYYFIKNSQDKVVKIYCDMEDNNGGWELIASFKDSQPMSTYEPKDPESNNFALAKASDLSKRSQIRVKVLNDRGNVIGDWVYIYKNKFSLGSRDLFRLDYEGNEFISPNGVYDFSSKIENNFLRKVITWENKTKKNYGRGILDLFSKTTYSKKINFVLGSSSESEVVKDGKAEYIAGLKDGKTCFGKSVDNNDANCIERSVKLQIWVRDFDPTPTFEGKSCLDILKNNPNATSGFYKIKLGFGIFDAYCDMETEGGGWTLASSFKDKSIYKDKLYSCYDSNHRSNCNTSRSKKEFLKYRNKDIDKLSKTKNIIERDKNLKRDYKNKDVQSYVGWNMGFSQLMFSNENKKYLMYPMYSYSAPLKVYYKTLKRSEEMSRIIPLYPSRTSYDKNINEFNELVLRIGSSDCDSRFYNKWNHTVIYPSWEKRNNNACKWDDGGISVVKKHLGGGSEVSDRIDMWVREGYPDRAKFIPLKSCYEIKTKMIQDRDGYYFIKPKTGKTIKVYCDMENGGLTFLPVLGNGYQNSRDMENYCNSLGLMLYVPRTKKSFKAMRDRFGIKFFKIMGIYPNRENANCKNKGFNSLTCKEWAPKNGGAWYVSDRTDISEPNGDNSFNFSMRYWYRNNDVHWYNDIRYPDSYTPNDGYRAREFACSSEDDKLAIKQ